METGKKQIEVEFLGGKRARAAERGKRGRYEGWRGSKRRQVSREGLPGNAKEHEQASTKTDKNKSDSNSNDKRHESYSNHENDHKGNGGGAGTAPRTTQIRKASDEFATTQRAWERRRFWSLMHVGSGASSSSSSSPSALICSGWMRLHFSAAGTI
ncbi:uncharacterized protein PV09_09166 [Verruconis gallopava]|uniref:Uncharacterized protein n=1 Tax=Verruconis gallopava TaxID=253628 RepID=A0A0D1XAC1_9PEZI|nr:uncharacterized protein PV09_09166 [Verruconis gallopava]KIV99135.1 hypothetical protein PV09_09166 [Verruconis gallopava]